IQNTTKTESSQYFNSLILTPRLESKGFGVYMPLMYNSLTDFTAGASFRFGSFFFGSGSVLSAALNQSKAADFFIGFHIGSRQKEE
ncbi:MAG: OmpA family protein, partial [Bacteroidota bacterium]|nr:OmpA family protein [Bacteroidota bacterium]